jgi:hypothetical protein
MLSRSQIVSCCQWQILLGEQWKERARIGTIVTAPRTLPTTRTLVRPVSGSPGSGLSCLLKPGFAVRTGQVSGRLHGLRAQMQTGKALDHDSDEERSGDRTLWREHGDCASNVWAALSNPDWRWSRFERRAARPQPRISDRALPPDGNWDP